MGRFVDLYALLSVPNDAPREAVEAAFAARAAELEAQRLPSWEQSSRLALLEHARAVLGDDFKRMAYDMSGEGGVIEDEQDPSKYDRPRLSALPEPEADAQNDPSLPLWRVILSGLFETYIGFMRILFEAFVLSAVFLMRRRPFAPRVERSPEADAVAFWIFFVAVHALAVAWFFSRDFFVQLFSIRRYLGVRVP